MKFRAFILGFVFLFACNTSNTDFMEAQKNAEINLISRPYSSTLVINQTFLGNEHRNFYGYNAPDDLKIIWKTFLGEGKTLVAGDTFTWRGAGWTGQPLMLKINDELFIIQGAYDHNLKKIRAKDGKIIDEYTFDDVIKGTGTIWSDGKEFYVLQGSRKGLHKRLYDAIVPSYRCIRISDMREMWRYNSVRLRSYSRDVDGSALILNDTAYLGLENGLFIVFSPNPADAVFKDGLKQPEIFDVDTLFYKSDIKGHGGNLVTESSPSLSGDYVYITSGSGHVFRYDLQKKQIENFFDTYSDMDGSPVVTNDSCILISIEKQYIPGNGGVMKLNPSLPAGERVIWFFPTKSTKFADWEGGVIGSVGTTDFYDDTLNLAAFVAIDSFLYVVKHNEIDYSRVAESPMQACNYPVSKLVFKYKTAPSISTPLFVDNKLIVATYDGVYLFEYDKNLKFSLLSHADIGSVESTPFVWNKRIYVAARNGFLYCLGEK